MHPSALLALLLPHPARTMEFPITCEVCGVLAGHPDTAGLCSRCHAAALRHLGDPILALTGGIQGGDEFVRYRRGEEERFEEDLRAWHAEADAEAKALAVRDEDLPDLPARGLRSIEDVDAFLGEALVTVRQACALEDQLEGEARGADLYRVAGSLALRVVDPFNAPCVRGSYAVAEMLARLECPGLPAGFETAPLTPVGDIHDRYGPARRPPRSRTREMWLPRRVTRQAVLELVVRRAYRAACRETDTHYPSPCISAASRGCRESWSTCLVCLDLRVPRAAELRCESGCRAAVCPFCVPGLCGAPGEGLPGPPRCPICRSRPITKICSGD